MQRTPIERIHRDMELAGRMAWACRDLPGREAAVWVAHWVAVKHELHSDLARALRADPKPAAIVSPVCARVPHTSQGWRAPSVK